MLTILIQLILNERKVSKYGVFSGPYLLRMWENMDQ